MDGYVAALEEKHREGRAIRWRYMLRGDLSRWWYMHRQLRRLRKIIDRIKQEGA